MKNLQTPWSRVVSDGRELSVHSIFPTIQGEGPYAGCPAVFVRLAGCNLQCPLCDTEYTAGAIGLEVEEVVEAVVRLRHASLVVLTGGEPFRQNVVPLLHALNEAGYMVQIETNGMLPVQNMEKLMLLVAGGLVDIVVSPKTPRLDPELAALAAAFKYVVKAGAFDTSDYLPTSALDHPLPHNGRVARPPPDWSGEIYIQPADEGHEFTKANTAAAVHCVLNGAGRRRLCIQTHKIAELP